jgi:hypothetical protein
MHGEGALKTSGIGGDAPVRRRARGAVDATACN